MRMTTVSPPGRFVGFLACWAPSDIRKVQELMLPVDDPDHQASLHLFQYRFPLDCERVEVLSHLRRFADGDQADLVSAAVTSAKVRSALQSFVREFLTGLSTIEQVTGEQFNFADCSIMNCLYEGAFLVSGFKYEVQL